MVLKGYLETQRYSGFLQLSRALADEPAGRLPLKNKVMNTDFGQRIALLALELIGDSAQLSPRPDKPGVRPGEEKWMAQFFGSLALSTAGGTANIQRNILAERGLGLPRETAGRAES
jgi:alkylation response protein AidB-like acyl-CoA dehydrogenase